MSPRLLTDADIERSIKLRTGHHYAPGWVTLALGLALAFASADGSSPPAVGIALRGAAVVLVLASAFYMGVGRERARADLFRQARGRTQRLMPNAQPAQTAP
jgi:hypothetical protein